MEPPRYGHLSKVKKGLAPEVTFYSLTSFLPSISRVSLLCSAFAFSFSYALGLPFVLFMGAVPQERVWVISIARLRTLPPVHLRPIDVVVFDDPYMEILSWGGLRA